MITTRRLALLLLVLVATAWAQSASQGSRQFLRAAATTSTQTVTTTVTPSGGGAPKPATRISFKNDGAVGTADVYVAINQASVTVPSDNATNIAITVKAGEEYKDGNCSVSQVSFRSATGTQAVRLTWAF